MSDNSTPFQLERVEQPSLAEYEKYVFHFAIAKEGDPRENGTATWISRSRCLTAYHVLPKSEDTGTWFPIVVDYRDIKDYPIRCKIVSYNKPWDWAMIELDTQNLAEKLQAMGQEIEIAEVNWMARKHWGAEVMLSICGFPLRPGGYRHEILTTREDIAVESPATLTKNHVKVEWPQLKYLEHSWEFDGISGGPVFNERREQIGIVLEYEARTRLFSIVETACVAEQWQPLKTAVELYRNGAANLQTSAWDEAVQKLKGAKRAFEEEAEVPAPSVLENMLATAEALQLLDKEDWDGAREKAARWEPLQRAVVACVDGKDCLRGRNWEQAEKKLRSCQSTLENDIRIPAPSVLENMLATAEALQLLDKEDWDGAREKAARWEPLQRAVAVCLEGKKCLEMPDWKEAKEKLELSKRTFENAIWVLAPTILEQMLDITEAGQLLDKKDWAGASRKVADLEIKDQQLAALVSDIRSRAEAGLKASDLYRQQGRFRGVWRLHQALDHYDHAIGNKTNTNSTFVQFLGRMLRGFK